MDYVSSSDIGVAMLTDLDLVDIRKWARQHRSWDIEPVYTKRIRDVGFELSYFSERGTFQESGHTKWLSAILEALSDEHFRLRKWDAKAHGSQRQPEHVLEALEDAIKEDEQELFDWHAEDPEAYFKTHDEVPSLIPHPWGADIVTLLRTAATRLTPYQVWRIQEQVEDAATETLRDYSLTLATGHEDGWNIEKTAVKAFNEAMDNLRTEWK
jgi:hypothetical protein